MDVVVRGRNVEVPDHFRQHVAEKIERVERYDHRIIRVDVELYHERNPASVRVLSTGRGHLCDPRAGGPLRRPARPTSTARWTPRWRSWTAGCDAPRIGGACTAAPARPTSVAAATGALALERRRAGGRPWSDRRTTQEQEEFGGLVVREKEHSAEPMTIDRALFEMELVGHDFYLFSDADTGRPSVVYRRKGYDYGVIRLVD